MKEKLKKAAKIVLPVLSAIFGLSISPFAFSFFASSASGKQSSTRIPSSDETQKSSADSAVPSLDSSLASNCFFGYHKTNILEANGTKKSVTFTLKPDNVSDKNIIVKSSDPSKVSVSAGKIKSGSSVNLCLKSVFHDQVIITAYSEIMPSASCTIKVSALELDSNYTKDLTIEWDSESGSYKVGDGKREDAYKGTTKNVIIPKNYSDGIHGAAPVTKISDEAFFESTMTSVSIPDSVLSIDGYSFHYSNLTSVSVPSSVKTIGNYAFDWCQSLASVSIPSSVVSIGDCAFGTTHLASIYFPASVTSLGNGVISDNPYLTTVDVDFANPKYVSKDNVLFTRDMRTLVGYPEGKSGSYYSIPSSVRTIVWYAFECSNLTKVYIPTSVTTIETWAFLWCRSLNYVVLYSSVQCVEAQAFDGCNCPIYCKASTKPNGWSNYWNTGNKSSVVCWGDTSH